MISVRYRHSHELSPGLNASVECSRRGPVVYLVPGLTRDERRAALRRLRMASRVGAGPELPAAQLALALLADRIRTAAWRAGAIFRLHPAASALPVLVLSAGVVVFLALSAMSIQVLPEQAVTGPSPVLGPAPAAAAGGTIERRPAFDPVNLVQARPPGYSGPPGPHGGSAARTRPGSTRSRSGSGGQGSGGQGSAGQGSAGQGSGGQGSGGQGSGGGNGTTLTGTTDPASTSGAVTGESSPGHAGTPTPAPGPPSPGPPSPSPPASGGGTCLQIGPLGVCLSL
jgi:hypothetical protein